MPKPIYVGVFLDIYSQSVLAGTVGFHHKNHYLDHLTLAFGNDMESFYPIGRIIPLQVTGEVADDKGQALFVSRDRIGLMLSHNQSPHITVSCADGTKPAYSNELIKSRTASTRTFGNPVVVTGIVDYFPRTQFSAPHP